MVPMFHAWGFSQLIFAASWAGRWSLFAVRPARAPRTDRRHQATGPCAVPLMFDRIMDLPDDVRRRYSGRSLRFATASGSRMRPDVVTKFMDEFGDILYNNYNATEAGMIATATLADLRAGRTCGKTRYSTEIRICDGTIACCPPARSARSSSEKATGSTATPPARARAFMTASWHPVTSADSTRPGDCTWSGATTR